MTTPKDFFLWLGAIIALYVSAGNLIALLFTIIEQVLSVKVIGYNPYSEGMSFAIASLFVVFPIYLILTRLVNQEQRRDASKRDIWVRRWGVYLTLFLAGGGMVIDLITLLYTFLQGEEITLQFFLKVLTVLVVFGGAFYYYLQEIKGHWFINEKRSKHIGAVVVVVVIAAIVAGFVVAGSPRSQRLLRYDSQRVADLTQIQYTITDYYRNKQELPADSATLKDPLEGTYIPVDPETGEAYTYEKTGAETFTLCATFSMPQIEVAEDADMSDYTVRNLVEQAEQWPHEAGRTCFERTIDPDNYEKFLSKPEILFR